MIGCYSSKKVPPTVTLVLSFFIFRVAKTQLHQWTRRVVTRLSTCPRDGLGADLVLRPTLLVSRTLGQRVNVLSRHMYVGIGYRDRNCLYYSYYVNVVLCLVM